MQTLTFYPLGNADCCLMETEKQTFLFDYANVKNVKDKDDLRIDLEQEIRNKLKTRKKDFIDVLIITHADDDHYCGFSKLFYLEHASKYQSDDRIKVTELWVPAAVINDTELPEEGKVLRQEARHRLKKKKGIRVFSSPDALKEWFEKENLDIEDFKDCLVDAGKLIPGYNLDSEMVEFFVHSPFAERQNDGTLVDKNQTSIVVQATFQNEEKLTKVIMSADTTCEAWKEIVDITKYHKNEARLNFDIFKLPHHCSYLSLSNDKGKDKTTPLTEVDWLFHQANEQSVIISTSKPIPANDDDPQPPHRQAANYYKDLMNEFEGEFKVTMEHPQISKPEPLIITITTDGAKIKKSLGTVNVITDRPAPRVGGC